MAKLVFYDADHRYTVDGQEVPSVSELTRFITREVYEDTPKLAMDNAAVRGTRIHRKLFRCDYFAWLFYRSRASERQRRQDKHDARRRYRRICKRECREEIRACDK